MADRRYETLVMIHPDRGESEAKDVAERIRTLLEAQGAIVSQVQDWGLRDLSYPIAKQSRAFYFLFEYRGTPAGLQETERNLKLMEPVLRFASIRQAENAPPAPARAARRDDREDGDFHGREIEGLNREMS